jgi:hypothetical protein
VWTPSKHKAATLYGCYNTPAMPESSVGNHFSLPSLLHILHIFGLIKIRPFTGALQTWKTEKE